MPGDWHKDITTITSRATDMWPMEEQLMAYDQRRSEVSEAP